MEVVRASAASHARQNAVILVMCCGAMKCGAGKMLLQYYVHVAVRSYTRPHAAAASGHSYRTATSVPYGTSVSSVLDCRRITHYAFGMSTFFSIVTRKWHDD
jgi:hypothetical protein